MSQYGSQTVFTDGDQFHRDQNVIPEGAGEILNCQPLDSNADTLAGGGLSYQKPTQPLADATFA